MNGTIGEIRGFAGNFAPRSWAFCSGQILAISQNTALFSVIGTTYGGDGRTSFALPDLRGRIPLNQGTGPGLTPRPLGQRSGGEIDYVSILQMPTHTHEVHQSYAAGPTTDNPGDAYPASLGVPVYGTVPSGHMGPSLVSNTGGSQYHNNMQPYLTIQWIICLLGTFPSRT